MKDFLWGAATSSHQIDGNNIHSDWWDWELAGKCEGGARSGAATDHWNRCEEDIKLAASLGLNTYRFSIEWAKLEPRDGVWDKSIFPWYENLLTACEKYGLKPMATLHHFTLPKWFADLGEFTAADSPKRFNDFVVRVVQRLGSRIPLWITINEPTNLIVGKYVASFMPPAQLDPRKASLANRNLLLAHTLAYDSIHRETTHRKGPWAGDPLQVGIAHNLVDFLPLTNWNPLERLMTRVFQRYYNRAWLDAVTGQKQHFGVTGLVPYPEPVKECLGRNTVDFLGLNYYMKIYVSAELDTNAGNVGKTLPIGIKFAVGDETQTDMGWAIHPSGLGRMLRFMHNYKLPIYITENGIADATDKLRPDYLKSHLKEVAKAIDQGIDVRGYYYWSLLDNFEWIKGFTPRFGLFEVDYQTLQRRKRESATMYQRIIEAHRAKNGGRPSLELISAVERG